MKKFILNFKQLVRFIVSIIVSREFAFVYCMIGTVAQVSHTYFLVNSISSLEGTYKTIQAVLISIFISSSLLFFTAISDNEDSDEARKIHKAVTMFTIIEIIINVYYYTRHLLLDRIDNGSKYSLFDVGFALMLSVLIPLTIKLYSSHIRAKDWINAIENDELAYVSEQKEAESKLPYFDIKLTNMEINDAFMQPRSEADILGDDVDDLSERLAKLEKAPANLDLSDEEVSERIIKPLVEDFQRQIVQLNEQSVEVNEEKVNELVRNIFNASLEAHKSEIDNQISASFERNSSMFLKQFENKVRLIISSNLPAKTA